jgi:hypothetical protein
MAGWVNAEEQDILEYWFAGTALPNTPAAIILFTTNPTSDSAAGTEVTNANGYARKAFAKNSTNWGSSTGADPSTISNLVAVTFPQCTTATWGTVKGWGYTTSATYGAGSLLFWAALDSNKTVNPGDTPNFAVGALVAKLGDPGDTY